MKKLIYVLFVLILLISCSTNNKQVEQKVEKPVDEDTASIFIVDTIHTRAYRDSVDRAIKAYSYRTYGDSNMLENGLPDSMKLHNY